MAKTVIVIQAREYSSRFPNKVMQTVGGKTMVRRVFDVAKSAVKHGIADKVRMLWPELYADEVEENNVLEKFRRIAKEENAGWIIRLTADCPLLSYYDIHKAHKRRSYHASYYNNYDDGHDVQFIHWGLLFDDKSTHREHVIKDPNGYASGGDSVNTKEDLERVRAKLRGE